MTSKEAKGHQRRQISTKQWMNEWMKVNGMWFTRVSFSKCWNQMIYCAKETMFDVCTHSKKKARSIQFMLWLPWFGHACSKNSEKGLLVFWTNKKPRHNTCYLKKSFQTINLWMRFIFHKYALQGYQTSCKSIQE